MQEQDTPRTPEEIRADISRTRGEVGDTVEALAAKTDVKAQAQHKVEEIKANVRAKTPGGAQQGGGKLADQVRANPAPYALAGAALFGFFVAKLADRRR